MAGDLEPLDAFAANAKRFARTKWWVIVDRGRDWLSAKLLALAIGAISGGALAITVLPIFAGVLCCAVTITAVLYAIYAHRLLRNERSIRRWGYVQGKRGEQRQLRAQTAIDNAILAVGGDRQARFSRQRTPELVSALQHLEARIQSERAAARPGHVPQHAPATPAGPDLQRVRHRLAERQAEVDALEAEIQSLAAPEDPELQADAKRQRQTHKQLADAAREADRHARDRRRRGKTPTVPPGTEIGMQLQIGPEGVRDVQPTPSARTPEQIAARALAQKPRP